MPYEEDEFLQLSGLQHFVFCRRQWGLIHIENQWNENSYTTQGTLFHSNAHDSTFREKRKNVLILRNLPVFSHTLGVSGNCDVVEFRADGAGIRLQGEEGLWLPYPIEYKKGKPKDNDADRLQLCCQAICLEEMLCTHIDSGSLFYGEIRHYERVNFSDRLRELVHKSLEEMHHLWKKGYTPMVKKKESYCRSCSLCDICLPNLKKLDSSNYLTKALRDE